MIYKTLIYNTRNLIFMKKILCLVKRYIFLKKLKETHKCMMIYIFNKITIIIHVILHYSMYIFKYTLMKTIKNQNKIYYASISSPINRIQ